MTTPGEIGASQSAPNPQPVGGNGAPEAGFLLWSDDGVSLVVAEGTTLLDGLLMLVAEVYGGEPFSPDNPAIVEALKYASLQVWRGPCSKAWCEDEGNVDTDAYDGWYAPRGDGPNAITVVDYDGGSLYDLGERAEAAEKTAQSGRSTGVE